LAALARERLHAFELMVGPYSVAHQRLGTFLQARNVVLNQRLPIYLVDTIAETLHGAVQSRFGPLGNELAQERGAAERLKRDEPVLVILGNPPYDRIRRAQLGDEWMQELLEDLKNRTPRGDRVNLKALYDYYIAFWRWASWLVSERQLASGQPQSRAIVAYITNRSWLLGRGFSGVRDLMSEIAREIWILDLGGDRRTSHTRLNDNNVFDVGVGVAITFVVVDRNYPGLPTVRYRRVWGTRSEKEHELNKDFEPADYGTVARSAATAPLVPIEWEELSHSPHLEQVFTQHETGVQTSRPWLIGIDQTDVLDTSGRLPTGTVGDWSRLTGREREDEFHPTRTHPRAPTGPVSTRHLTRYAYRPMDYRVLYNDAAFIEWPRPTLQPTFTTPNLALVTIERGFGTGPAAIPVDALPDLHIFRGFAGARGIYPLFGAPPGGQGMQTMSTGSSRPVNLDLRVQQWANSVLPQPAPEDVFAYVTGLLNAPSYTATFEGGLAVERPRVPLTEDSALAQETVRAGREVLEAWLLRRAPASQIRWDATGRTAPVFGETTWTPPDRLAVAERYLEGVTWDTWEFEVSGYPVLKRYCRDRRDRPTSAPAMDELRRVVGSIRMLVEMGVALDDLLTRVLRSRLLVW
jgi:predicted helicase